MNPSRIDCQLAMKIALQQTRGLAPTHKERLAFDNHVQTCRSCLAEKSIIEILLKDKEKGSLDDISRRRMADRVISEIRQAGSQTSSKPNRTVNKQVIFAAALSVMAASVAIIVLATGSVGTRETGSGVVGLNASNFEETKRTQLAKKSETKETASSNLNDLIETKGGRTAVKLSNRTKLLLGEKSKMAVGHMRPESIEVSLYRGELLVAIDPEQKGPKFSLVTPHGKIEVVGTVFKTIVEQDSSSVEVLRGKVLIEEDSDTHNVSESDGYTFGKETQRWGLLASDQVALRNDLEELQTLETDATALIDFSKFSEKTGTLAKTDQLTPRDSRVTKNGVQSTSELLDEVRLHRKTGNFERAAETYELLIRTHPATDAAMASLVALGELELSRLANPTAALKRFSKYLRTGETSLAEEAALGKARALRALGRTEQEREALEYFKYRFSTSPHVSEVRKRLDTIASKGDS